MSRLLDNKSAIITGAASGIGRATAQAFVKEGAQVLLADVNEHAGNALVAELRAQGATAYFIRVDVTQEFDVEAMLAAALQHFGRLDCAINNAGLSGNPMPLDHVSIEEWNRIIAVDLTGIFLCMKHQLRAMKSQGFGSIVNVSSGSGLIATPFLSPYCAAKHGILGLTKTAATENAKLGIRVNAVLPGSTQTPMIEAVMEQGPEAKNLVMNSIPCGRLGKPEEIAESMVWLSSDRASYVSGMSMLVDMASVCR